MALLLRIAALAATVLLPAACATQEDKVVRWPLAERVVLEATMPKGWQAEPSFADVPRRLSLVRFSARGPETALLRVQPREPARTAPAQAREVAARELAASRGCDGVGTSIEDRSLGRAIVVSCSRPRDSTPSTLVPRTAGVLVLPELVVHFAMVGLNADETAAAWAILQSLQVSTIVLSP